MKKLILVLACWTLFLPCLATAQDTDPCPTSANAQKYGGVSYLGPDNACHTVVPTGFTHDPYDTSPEHPYGKDGYVYGWDEANDQPFTTPQPESVSVFLAHKRMAAENSSNVDVVSLVENYKKGPNSPEFQEAMHNFLQNMNTVEDADTFRKRYFTSPNIEAFSTFEWNFGIDITVEAAFHPSCEDLPQLISKEVQIAISYYKTQNQAVSNGKMVGTFYFPGGDPRCSSLVTMEMPLVLAKLNYSPTALEKSIGRLLLENKKAR